jgi:hypothetical protein
MDRLFGLGKVRGVLDFETSLDYLTGAIDARRARAVFMGWQIAGAAKGVSPIFH